MRGGKGEEGGDKSPDMKKVKKFSRKESHEPRKAEYRDKQVTLYEPEPSDAKTKKLQVFVQDPDTQKIRKVSFGHPEYEDYTTHGDRQRRENYCARSSGIKGTDDVTSANYWSRKVLWKC